MPQLDVVTFFSQIVVCCIVFSVLFIFLSCVILPQIFLIKKTRKVFLDKFCIEDTDAFYALAKGYYLQEEIFVNLSEFLTDLLKFEEILSAALVDCNDTGNCEEVFGNLSSGVLKTLSLRYVSINVQ